MDNIIEESLDVKMPVKEFSTDRNEGDRLNFYPFEDFIQWLGESNFQSLWEQYSNEQML
mgnify:FL=1